MIPHAPNQDRQVLVIGETPIALLTAGFLEHAGLDPVVAASTERRSTTEPIVLWRSALQLLERLGLRRPIERSGTALTQLKTTRIPNGDAGPSTESFSTGRRDRPALVALTRQQLSYLIDEYLGDRLRHTERSVRRLEATANSVAVTFDSAVVEPFDVVVSTTQRSTPAQSSSNGAAAVHSWEFDWPRSLPTPPSPSEVWTEQRALFTVPYSDGLRVQLLSTAEPTQAAAAPIETLAERFDPLFTGFASPLNRLDEAAIQYRKQPLGGTQSVTIEEPPVVGIGMSPMYPGDCLSATARVEEGWILADTVAYGPAAVDAAVTAFDRRRRERSRDLTATADRAASGSRCKVDLHRPLDRICHRRTIAFSHVMDSRYASLGTNIPERL